MFWIFVEGPVGSVRGSFDFGSFCLKMEAEGNELGVDWGDNEPAENTSASPLEPETKRQRVLEPPDTESQQGPKSTEREIKVPERVRRALKESSGFEDFRRKRCFRFLHAFAGPEDVLGRAITAEAEKARLQCEIHSLDRQMDRNVDMADASQHRRLMVAVKEGEYDGFHGGFPCGSFSMARWSKNPGPPPVRSSEEIYGLASNSAERQAEADRGTIMASHAAWLMEAQVETDKERRVPTAATLENPPGDGRCGPAWLLPEVTEALKNVDATKTPYNTCAFQTKLKVRHFKPGMWCGRLEGLGSLNRVCRCPAWVRHEPLVGKFMTEKAGRYPDELCQEIAKLVVEGWKRTLKLEFWRWQLKVQEKAVSQLQHKWLLNEEKKFDAPDVKRDSQKKFENSLSRALAAEDVNRDAIPSSSRTPAIKEIKEQLNEEAIGGMRNPSKAVARLQRVREVGDQLRRLWNAFELEEWDITDVASQYGSEEAKFLEVRTKDWKKRILKLWKLDRQEPEVTLREPDEFVSPLDWELWQEWQRRSKDPDHNLALHMKKGVPMGMELEIPDTGGVFPKILGATDPEEVPEVEFSTLKETSNYRSVSDNLEDAQIEIDRYVRKGFAIRKPWSWVEAKFSKGTCSKMALIVKEKADGTKKRRIVIDMRRSMGNARCRISERITLPRVQDLVADLRRMIERKNDLKDILLKRYGPDEIDGWDESEFVLIDLRDAFCHFGVDPREWKHTITPDEKEEGALLWPAMLFGYKAAPLHMGRLASAIGRILQSMASPAEMTSQIYMDDIILLLRGTRRHRNHVLAMVLYMLECLGVQIALEKGERGTRVRWIGTTLEIQETELTIGIQNKMVEEITAELQSWSSMGMVPLRDLRKITGKLSWIAGIIPRVKWVVNALYSVMASVQKDELAGLETSRAASRSDQRPKLGLVPYKRLKNAVEWMNQLLKRKDILLYRHEPFIEAKIQYGIVTDASPRGLGGMLIRLRLDGEVFEIVEAFEAPFTEKDASLLKVAFGEASSQGAVETLAVLRALHKWAPVLTSRPILVRSDSTVALGVAKKGGSPTPTLNYLAAELSLALESFRIKRVVVQHLRGTDNKETDWLSRMHDRGEKPKTLEGVKIFRLTPCHTCSGLYALSPPGGVNPGEWSEASAEPVTG